MQIKQKNHSIDSLFSFLLLLIFCLFTLMLSGMGSTIYRNGTAYLNENYTSRTAVAYVAEKVRQHDETGAVFLTSVEAASSDRSAASEELPAGKDALSSGDSVSGKAQASADYSDTEERSGSIPALALRDTIDGTEYLTYVYFYDNALCELMVQEDRTPEAAMGSRIVELSSLSIDPLPGTNLLSVTAAGEEGSELSELVHVSGGLE